MLWTECLCPSKISYVEDVTLIVMVSGDGALGKIIRVRWVHEGRGPGLMRLVPL